MPVYQLGARAPVLPPKGEYWIAPDAHVIGSVELKSGVSVWFGAVVRGDTDPIVVGENTNIQDGSVLHTDDGVPLVVGANVTIGHMVMLHGCTIGDGCLIGIGAVVLNGAKLGKGCLVGANTLITEGKEFPDHSLIVGSPGRAIRQLTPEESAHIAHGAEHYLGNWRAYASGLRLLET